jgi:DNA-binding CsgD family transcriptional regulator
MNAEVRATFSPLTTRERRAWVLVAAGCGRRDVANGLDCGVRTAESIVKALYNKIGARGIADATRLAVTFGVIVVPKPQFVVVQVPGVTSAAASPASHATERTSAPSS